MVLTSAIEVGIAIAGFTGIVIALSRRDGDESARALLVSILLLASIASVFFAFLPMLLSLGGMGDASVWRACSAIFLVYIVGVGVYRWRQIGTARRASPAVVAGGSLFLAAVLLQLPNILVWGAAGPYLVLIVAYVLYAFSIFVALVWDVWRDLHET